MPRSYVPARHDVVWLDFEPTKGREIGKYRPALILSSKPYHTKTGIVICCPISTQIRGADIEVPIKVLGKPSVIVSSQVHSLPWRDRKAKKITTASIETVDAVMARLLPFIGADEFIVRHRG